MDLLNTVKITTLQSRHLSATTKPNGPLSAHLYIFTKVLRRHSIIADHTVLELYEVLVIFGFIFSIHFYRN